MASITLPRPSRKGNPTNDVDLKTCLNKRGAGKGQRKKRAVSTEASTQRVLEFGGPRLHRYGGLMRQRSMHYTTYRDSIQVATIREGQERPIRIQPDTNTKYTNPGVSPSRPNEEVKP